LLAAAVALVPACRERQEAVASEVPHLEVKAEIAKPQTATVVAPYDGRIETIGVAEGASVKAGDVIVTIANPTVERDVAYSRAQLAIAEYRLRHANAPRRSSAPRNNGDNDDRIAAIEEIAKSRKTRLDRYEHLYKTHDITADELENARMEYAAAQRDLAAERNARQQAEVAAPSDPALLKLDLERARAEAAVVEDRRRQLTVTAPIAGVVSRIFASAGETIFPRDPILEITNAATLEVRGVIAPELLRHVRAGMPVDVKVFTVPPRRFSATIRNITPPTAEGAAIVVVIANPEGVLQPGTAATITVR
jgi:membrane fusion protein (multidrug efflux system)